MTELCSMNKKTHNNRKTTKHRYKIFFIIFGKALHNTSRISWLFQVVPQNIIGLCLFTIILQQNKDTKEGNSHNTTSPITPSSSKLTLTTTQEQPTILRAFPVLSILHRPAHSPSFLLLSTLMSGIWCSLQRACTSFLYIGSLQFSARTHSKACRLQQQFHSTVSYCIFLHHHTKHTWSALRRKPISVRSSSPDNCATQEHDKTDKLWASPTAHTCTDCTSQDEP